MTIEKNTATLDLSEKEMRDYGYKVIDAIVDHYVTQNDKLPVVSGTREEMAKLFQKEPPAERLDPVEILDFVVDEIMTKSNIVTHPKSYSFVPGPSNFISAMADALAAGFNVFSGGWQASPAAAAMEINCINWLLGIFGFPRKRGGGIFTSGGSMANLTA